MGYSTKRVLLSKLAHTIIWGAPLLMIWFGLFEDGINSLKSLIAGGLILTINAIIASYNLTKGVK